MNADLSSHDILARYLAGHLSAEIALMQLAAEAQSPAQLESWLAAPSGGRAKALRSLARANPEAWRLVRSILAVMEEWGPDPRAGEAATIRRLASAFDKAAAISPEASVALFSFGNERRLAAATSEIRRFLRDRGLLQRHTAALDLGCGIGRLVRALAQDVGSILGVDISARMVAEARRRCSGLANVEIRKTNGLDLRGLPDDSIDLAIALDSFPYLVSAGETVVDRNFAELSRVMRAAGNFLVFNFSYRGDFESDRRDIEALSARHGFLRRRISQGDFQRWDGSTFHLVRRMPGPAPWATA